MFRLVVFIAFVALATAAPGGYLHAVPVATSHQKRVDIIESSPILKEIITPIHVIPDHSEEDIHDLHDIQVHDYDHILEDASYNDIHIASPVADTILVSAPQVVKTVSSHQEVHQVHASPAHDLETIVVDAPEVHQQIPVIFAEDDVHQSVVFAEEDVHHPVVSSIESHQVHDTPLVHSIVVEDPQVSFSSHEEVHQVHDIPVHQIYETPIHSLVPVVVSHEVVPQVHHGLLDLSAVKAVPAAVSHTSRMDVHKSSVVLPEVHVW